MTEKPEQDILNQLSATLDEAAEDIDAQTLSKIRQARHRALDTLDDKTVKTGWWLPAGFAATACLVFAVLIALPQATQESQEPGAIFEDIELITSSDELDLYEELEFYEWLEMHELPS